MTNEQWIEGQMKKGGQRFDIQERTFKFAVRVVKLAIVHCLIVHCQGSVRR